MSLSVRRRGRSVLTFAALFATFLGAAVYAQETEKPGIAVYVAGDVPANEKKVLGAYLLNAVVKAGRGQIGEEADAFLAAATADEHAKGGAILSKARVCELGRQFNIKYICAATVTQAFDFYLISTRMVDTETEEVLFKGEVQSPLKTINDLTQVSNQTAESMFGVNIADTQTAAAPPPTQNAESATGAPSAAPTAALSLTGDAKIAVDMVVTAVNAFKDATAKSIDAANAVKTAAQSKNYSAIMDAKKKVTSATEAVKKAKADVTAAINTLNSAGPEAQAAVKAMGIDLSMFGGSADKADETDDGGEGDGASFYFTPKYQSPVGTPVSWGGVNAEIGWVWRNGAVFGIDLSFGVGDDCGDDCGNDRLMGLGLSLGKEYDFKNQMQVVYGMAGGFWMVGGKYGESFNFLAPFVKYRVSNYEVTYRGLMGIKEYGGFGYNSHQTMVGYQFRRKPGERKSPRKLDYYISPKYQTPVGTPVPWGGVNAEAGWIWGDGAFFGIDFSYGATNDGVFYLNYLNGLGLSLGNAYDLGNEFQFVYGMSVGLWGAHDEVIRDFGTMNMHHEVRTSASNFLGPFVKLRYSIIEITYRGLLGTYNNGYYDVDEGFGWNNHQLMLGLYFATNKRQRN